MPKMVMAARSAARLGSSEVAEGVGSGLAALTELGLVPDPDGAQAIWHDAVAAPGWAGHGSGCTAICTRPTSSPRMAILCGIVDFGDLCAGDPAVDLAACWVLLPDEDGVRRFQRAYQLTADAATWRRARGWAVWRAVGSLLIAEAGRHGLPGGKPTWGPPALASLRRLTASVA
jgi:hypothetical protein